MTRIIFCSFLKKYSAGQDFQSYPGKLGKKIYDNISKKAWEKWMIQQTILINEYKLDMSQKQDRQNIEIYMKKFLFKKD